jgi:hypothetical protein
MECILPFLAIAICLLLFLGTLTIFDMMFTKKFQDFAIYPMLRKLFSWSDEE